MLLLICPDYIQNGLEKEPSVVVVSVQDIKHKFKTCLLLIVSGIVKPTMYPEIPKKNHPRFRFGLLFCVLPGVIRRYSAGRIITTLSLSLCIQF